MERGVISKAEENPKHMDFCCRTQGGHKTRITLQRLLEQPLSFDEIIFCPLVEVPQTTLVQVPRIQVFRTLGAGSFTLSFVEFRLHGSNQALRQIILHGKDVGSLSVVALGPDLMACVAVDQLRSEANSITDFADTALQKVSRAEITRDLSNIAS